MPTILSTQEVEIRRIEIQSQPGLQFQTLSQKKIYHKKGLVEVAQGVSPEFKAQYCKKKKKKERKKVS
jgi:hypothetical protein